MARMNEELVFLILQYCKEDKLFETAHMLECETAVFFDLNYFEALVLSGSWDEVERYLSGYGTLEGNKYLRKVYLEVRKQKLFEALDMGDCAKALKIVRKELKVFASYSEELFKEITQLLTLDDFREHELLSSYGDIHSARRTLSKELTRIIKADPSFHGKLGFPTFEMARLRRLINQSLNWQHMGCKNPKSFPDISTILKDHICEKHEEIEPPQTEATTVSCSWSSDLHGVNNTCSGNSAVTSDVVEDPSEFDIAATLQEVECPSSGQSKPVDLPKNVACVLNENSSPTTMDFLPVDDSVLLVGTDIGDIALWDLLSKKKVFCRSFNVWDIGACTMIFRAAFVKDPHVSVKSVAWSPDGDLIGVAYSKHIVQLYTYQPLSDVLPSLEIDAHSGSVNDIAFAKPDKETFVITCGDDKLVKVWDTSTGAKRCVFDDHEAAVTCISPQVINGVHLIFSTSTTGEMRGWMYDNLGYRLAFNDPCCRRMVCMKNGKRIFTCGVNEEEKFCILEWDDVKGSVKRQYQGIKKPFPGVVHLDTAKDKILAAGDDHEVKFWNMSNLELLASTDVGGDLPVYPYVRFSKEGRFLAASAKKNGIVILATQSGLEFIKPPQKHLPQMFAESDGRRRLLEAAKPITIGKDNNGYEAFHFPDDHIYPEVHFRILSADVKGGKICRLVYTNAGTSIVALTSSGTHLVWKWPGSDTNTEGNKGTTRQKWRLKNDPLMTNILSTEPDVEPCFALTKNGSYLISASGGEFSLFNMVTFKRLTTFMPDVLATAVALYPKDNNVIAIGSEDSTIVIYNIRMNEIKCKLEGHSKRITDLAFSNALHKMISFGADAKIVAWDSESWERQESTCLPSLSGARIQFHPDQLHFLTIQDTVLAIYEAMGLECKKQWLVGKSCSPISHAAFSCDGKMIYTCFHDASLSVFDASNFQLIACTSVFYLPDEYLIRPDMSRDDVRPRPLEVASHPQKACQFALGLQDGNVVVIQPLEPHSNWLVSRE